MTPPRFRSRTTRAASRLVAVAALVGLVAPACSSSDGDQRSLGSTAGTIANGSAAAGTDGAPAGGSVVFATSLTITDDPATTASAVIGAAGGSLAVTAGDGTVFTLEVPVDALNADTTISATATTVAGIDGAAALHAVHFEPAGLQFVGAASLHIQTTAPIAEGYVLPFQSASDGSDPQVAIIDDPATTGSTIALLVAHFSVFGIAELVDSIRDALVGQPTATVEAQLQGDIAWHVEIRRGYLREGRSTAEIDSVLQTLFLEYLEKVITPLVEGAPKTCAGAFTVAQATSNYYYLWLHNSLPTTIVSMKAVAESAFLTMERLCEEERIDECVDSGDDTVLSTFWRDMNRWRGRFAFARKMGDDPALYETRAKKICKGYAYFITGGLQDFQVQNVKVCDVRKPFSLTSPGVATAEFSGGKGLTGTYSATGAFNLTYAGTYTILLPAGPGEVGTMSGTSGGQIAGQAGSGTEKYVLTPAYDVC